MPSRAMIVVGGGSSTRFGRDKLMAEVDGRPLISHTIAAVAAVVDTCVVVSRSEIVDDIARLHPEVVVTAGGATRTTSEMAGLAALDREPDLVGIHDAARPLISPDLMERLFELAAEHGGAVPVLAPDRPVMDVTRLRSVAGVVLAQTPQVFRGAELMAGYRRAAEAGFEGHDTIEVMQRFADVEIVAVAGEEDNLKVTFPPDLTRISALLSDPSRIEPR